MKRHNPLRELALARLRSSRSLQPRAHLEAACQSQDAANYAGEWVHARGDISPSSRIGPKGRIGGVLNQRLSLKGLHYREAGWARAAAVILGGGCDGKVSLSWLIRSCSSGSGWV